MSASMFKTPSKDDMHPTKIPVPQSPSPLRRSISLRMKGETALSFHQPHNNHLQLHHHHHHQFSTLSTKRRTLDVNQNVRPDRPPSVGSLRRGNSFVERGTLGLGNGTRYIPQTSNRSRDITTESKSKGSPPIGGPSPEGNGSRTRSLSLSLSNTHLSVPKSPAASASPRTPPASPDVRHRHYKDWDTESVTSANSNISVASSCDHASVARNGTTFSGRSMKYVVHCNQHAGVTGEDYLTPTQRAHRQVKRLKALLQQAQKDLEQKDNDIVKLTKEVVELRLYKAALSSPEDKSNSSDAVTVRENTTDEQATPDGDADVVDVSVVGNHLSSGGDLSCSYADSGHYDDFTNSSVHSKESVVLSEDYSPSPYKHRKSTYTCEKATSADLGPRDFNQEHQRLITEYEKRLQELVRTHEEETHQVKQRHNDKIEELLQRITEINTRYWQLVPELECAKDRIKELEKDLDEACKKLEDQDEKHKQTYLQMYDQGKEAARLEQEQKVMDLAIHNPSRISVSELLQQLQSTQSELENLKDVEYASCSNNKHPLLSAKEAVSLWVLGARKAMYRQLVEAKSKNKIDPEITLQFLKSAIYYFLTDKENSQGHLRAIQSILGFTPTEISNIEKCRTS